MAEKKIKVIVRTDSVFHDGKNYPHGAELALTEKEAAPLLKAGYVEAVKA